MKVNHTEVLSYYQDREKKYRDKYQQTSRLRNYITMAKVICFLAIGYILYRFAVKGEWFLLGICAVFVLFFIGLTVWDNQVYRKLRIYEEVVKDCGEELAYLMGNYKNLKTGNEYFFSEHPYVHDLDILGQDSLFMHIDRTSTSGGSDKLAEWLLNPCKDEKEIQERQEAVKELGKMPDWCGDYRVEGKLHRMTGENKQEAENWLKEEPFFKGKGLKYPVFAFNAITLTAWVLVIFSIIPFSLALVLSFIQLMWLSLYLKKINVYYGKLGEFVNIMVNYFYLIKQIEKANFTSLRMQELKESLFSQETDSLVAFGKLRKLLSGFDQRNNFLVGFVRNGLYMSDFHFLMDLDKWKAMYGEQVNKWMQAVHETDVLCSMATYHFNHPDFIFPTLSQEVWMEAQAMGHPLLSSEICVCNDIEIRKEHNFYVITGANMAGKSTFLRAVGVNLVLALSGNVVFSQEFTFGIMDLFTSMRTTDNLAKGISYFHAELLRLKKLTEVAENSERLFIILDEMLKGTNSTDKLNGSMKFLERLLLYPVSGLIATHDLALGKLAEKYPGHFFNSCFEIAPIGEEIKYDYKLKEGVSQNMNASLLMEQMGLIEKEAK